MGLRVTVQQNEWKQTNKKPFFSSFLFFPTWSRRFELTMRGSSNIQTGGPGAGCTGTALWLPQRREHLGLVPQKVTAACWRSSWNSWVGECAWVPMDLEIRAQEQESPSSAVHHSLQAVTMAKICWKHCFLLTQASVLFLPIKKIIYISVCVCVHYFWF